MPGSWGLPNSWFYDNNYLENLDYLNTVVDHISSYERGLCFDDEKAIDLSERSLIERIEILFPAILNTLQRFQSNWAYLKTPEKIKYCIISGAENLIGKGKLVKVEIMNDNGEKERFILNKYRKQKA